jgi:hypothetical protein
MIGPYECYRASDLYPVNHTLVRAEPCQAVDRAQETRERIGRSSALHVKFLGARRHEMPSDKLTLRVGVGRAVATNHNLGVR